VPPFLFCLGRMELDTVKTTMLAATVLWFVITPFWMGRKGDAAAAPSAGSADPHQA